MPLAPGAPPDLPGTWRIQVGEPGRVERARYRSGEIDHRLRAIDGSVERRDKEIGVLRQVPLLQPLPIPMIESLAAHGVRD